MALTNKPTVAFIASRALSQYHTATLHGIEKASSTWKKGAVLVDDGAGNITEATSPVGGAAQTNLVALGIATAAATGTTAKDVQFVPFTPGQLFVGTLTNNGAGASHTLGAADLWTTVALFKDGTFSTGLWVLNTNNASTTTITQVVFGATIIELVDPVGTVDGRVLFRVSPVSTGSGGAF